MGLLRKIKGLQNRQGGFTLAELVIVLPVATIITVSLVSILFTQYGSVLAESSRANLRASGQALLTTMQDELLFTIEYGHTLQENLSDPNDPSGGWTYDTDPDTLIIHEIALDGTRADDNRNIIRRRVSNCESSTITSNPVALNTIIYFIEPIANSQFSRLVKRTITPEYNTCSIDRTTGDPCTPTTSTCFDNAKETTCPEGVVGTGSCSRADSILSEKVLDFSVRYFAVNNVETNFPSAGQKIEVSLTLGDNVYGRDVEVEVNHTVRKIN